MPRAFFWVQARRPGEASVAPTFASRGSSYGVRSTVLFPQHVTLEGDAGERGRGTWADTRTLCCDEGFHSKARVGHDVFAACHELRGMGE